MEPIICLICHEAVRVPVRFVCFPCPHTHGGQACNDMIRVCLVCARSYLELNKRRQERVHSRKCLMCRTEVNPNYLNAESAYAKDFLLMSMDTNVYPCYHSDKGCEFTGCQQELDRHMQQACGFRTMYCPERNCRGVFLAKDLEEHQRTGCANYGTCRICSEVVHKNQIISHMMSAHQLEPCRSCGVFQPTADMAAHYETCPERKIQCPNCHTDIRRREYHNHLHAHVATLAQTIETKTQQVANLSREIGDCNEQLRHLMGAILQMSI